MGNVVVSVFSGFGQLLDKILGHPLEFLSGKSCDSVCAPTWDLFCYIENFCVSHLLKLLMVATLVYFVLLFFYLVYNIGICQCICHVVCGTLWACFSTYFSALNFCCTYLCLKLRSVKRRRRKRRRDIEELAPPSASEGEDHESEEGSRVKQPKNYDRWRSHKSRNFKHEHLRRSLRPTSHLVHLGYVGSSNHLHRRKIPDGRGERSSPLHHHVRVTRSSRFSRKASRHRMGMHYNHKRRQELQLFLH